MIKYNVQASPDGEEFELTLNKCTILLGPNGSGKTTILKSMEECIVEVRDRIIGYEESFSIEHISDKFKSEGEGMMSSFSRFCVEIGRIARSKKYQTICFDSIDSGLSLNNLSNISSFIRKFLFKDFKHIVITANSYEIVELFPEAKIFWVPTREYITIKNYEEFKKLYV